MKYQRRFTTLMFIVILCAVILSCGGKKDEPIFKPEDEAARYSKETGGLYNIEGNAPVQDTSKDQPYQSPFGPKTLKEIQWASSVNDAKTRARAGTGLKILVWVTNRACDECGRLEKEVFTDEVVLKEAGKYIWVKFDTDTDPQMKKYYIQDKEPPALVWIDQAGNSYHKLFGGFDNAELLARYLRDWH